MDRKGGRKKSAVLVTRTEREEEKDKVGRVNGYPSSRQRRGGGPRKTRSTFLFVGIWDERNRGVQRENARKRGDRHEGEGGKRRENEAQQCDRTLWKWCRFQILPASSTHDGLKKGRSTRDVILCTPGLGRGGESFADQEEGEGVQETPSLPWRR